MAIGEQGRERIPKEEGGFGFGFGWRLKNRHSGQYHSGTPLLLAPLWSADPRRIYHVITHLLPFPHCLPQPPSSLPLLVTIATGTSQHPALPHWLPQPQLRCSSEDKKREADTQDLGPSLLPRLWIPGPWERVAEKGQGGETAVPWSLPMPTSGAGSSAKVEWAALNVCAAIAAAPVHRGPTDSGEPASVTYRGDALWSPNRWVPSSFPLGEQSLKWQGYMFWLLPLRKKNHIFKLLMIGKHFPFWHLWVSGNCYFLLPLNALLP